MVVIGCAIVVTVCVVVDVPVVYSVPVDVPVDDAITTNKQTNKKLVNNYHNTNTMTHINYSISIKHNNIKTLKLDIQISSV